MPIVTSGKPACANSETASGHLGPGRAIRIVSTPRARLIFSFAVLQVCEPVMHGLHLPEWTLSAVVAALARRSPTTTVLARVFDIRSGGIERTCRC